MEDTLDIVDRRYVGTPNNLYFYHRDICGVTKNLL